MVNKSRSGRWRAPRDGGMGSPGGGTTGEPKDEEGRLGPTNLGSATELRTMGDHQHQHLTDGDDPSSREAGYGCSPSRQQLASGQVSTSRSSNLDVDTTVGTNKTLLAESRDASPEPPVTKTTLSELDVPRIVYNPKLRHDVNFDPDLHFRPNLDGESGRKKIQKATDFWNLLRTQLEAFMEDPVAFETSLAGREWCLQSTLQAIGEILGTLVPPEDRSAVEEILNVELLMQQFRKGVADLEKLSQWLARTLKSHCAPMRDEWVDEMVSQLIIGNRDRAVTLLVQGLQSLLSILEAMKLDVANHQIRCLRPLLIQDTVEFEQTFFMKKIALGKINIREAYSWFQASKSASDNAPLQCGTPQGDMWVFFKGFTDLLLPSKMGTTIPDTFMFDEERIIKLRADILDAINLDICIRLLKDIQMSDRTRETPSKTTSRATSPGPRPVARNSATGPPVPPHQHNLQREIEPSNFPNAKRLVDKQTRLDGDIWIIEPEGEENESDIESPPSTARVSAPSPKSPCLLSQSVEASLASTDAKLRQSILDIVDDTMGNNRWQQSCSNIALQLLYSNPNFKDLSKLESKLESQLRLHLSNPTSSTFQISESRILAEFYPLLSDLTTRNASLTATQLFEAATSPRPLPCQVRAPRPALSDIAKQMAHIGILHWRVWAPLAYLVNPDDTGHVTATEPESRRTDQAWDLEAENDRRRSPQRQNSISESIKTSG